jgi:hypothetical protein
VEGDLAASRKEELLKERVGLIEQLLQQPGMRRAEEAEARAAAAEEEREETGWEGLAEVAKGVVNVCVCVCVCTCICVCVRKYAAEEEREETGWEGVCVCVCVCV